MYTLEEMTQKLIAVHRAKILPISGKLIPGNCKHDIMKSKCNISELPNLRPTLHWMLGAAVEEDFYPRAEDYSDYFGNEDVPYIIITRLINLIPQLANLYMSDTFIIGEYQLSSNDIQAFRL